MKIKAVLNDSEKDRLENLYSHIEVAKSRQQEQPEFPNHFLTDIQHAVVRKEVLRLNYFSSHREEENHREVEPIGLYHYSSSWHLIGWCRLRNDYRDFRADRIKELFNTGEKFDGRNLLSIQQYASQIASTHGEIEKVVLCFDKAVVRYVGEQKYTYGFVSEENVGDKVKMMFLTSYPMALARWLFMFGNMVEVDSPASFKERVAELLFQLNEHHKIDSIHDKSMLK